MQPNIIKAGLCSTVSAAVVLSLTGLMPQQAAAAPEPAGNQLAGKTIFLDPGHQGPGHSENLARQVDNGRGGTKDCQTTGMVSRNGVPEHTINWQVSELVQASLQALGADVVLSRADDTGWGGCIDERAQAANASGAAVAVSIHADSAPADQRGFHLIVPELPIPDPAADAAQSGAGRAASAAVRDAYLAAGFPAATYAGVSDGLQTRADVAGPALTKVPLVFVEMGNGANPEDAALLESREGQLEHAIAITTGVVGFLLNKPVVATGDRPVDAADTTGTPEPAQAVDPNVPAPMYSGSAGDRPAVFAPAPAELPVSPPGPVDPTTEPTPVPAEPATTGETTPTPAPTESAGSGDPTPTPAPADPAATDGATPTPAQPPEPDGAVADSSTSPTGTPAPTTTAPAAGDSSRQGPASQEPTTPQLVAPAGTPVSADPGLPSGSSGHFTMPGGEPAPADPEPAQQRPAAPMPPTGSGAHLTFPDVTEVRTAPPGAAEAPAPRSRTVEPEVESPDEPELDLGSLSSAMGGPVRLVMELLMPLAQALGADDTVITNQLINLAYTLVGLVFGPAE
ncbi:N-acetylmuramoyl-L-alanine amidase [Nocardia rhizosphaerae]|uniref:N-acetylmuramoyl-L-alanine amidase n=1 Tax=Nocardia rhizosphaerae TaxID=1691571 RepID=A0ABV8L746_9NOCA